MVVALPIICCRHVGHFLKKTISMRIAQIVKELPVDVWISFASLAQCVAIGTLQQKHGLRAELQNSRLHQDLLLLLIELCIH